MKNNQNNKENQDKFGSTYGNPVNASSGKKKTDSDNTSESQSKDQQTSTHDANLHDKEKPTMAGRTKDGVKHSDDGEANPFAKVVPPGTKDDPEDGKIVNI